MKSKICELFLFVVNFAIVPSAKDNSTAASHVSDFVLYTRFGPAIGVVVLFIVLTIVITCVVFQEIRLEKARGEDEQIEVHEGVGNMIREMRRKRKLAGKLKDRRGSSFARILKIEKNLGEKKNVLYDKIFEDYKEELVRKMAIHLLTHKTDPTKDDPEQKSGNHLSVKKLAEKHKLSHQHCHAHLNRYFYSTSTHHLPVTNRKVSSTSRQLTLDAPHIRPHPAEQQRKHGSLYHIPLRNTSIQEDNAGLFMRGTRSEEPLIVVTPTQEVFEDVEIDERTGEKDILLQDLQGKEATSESPNENIEHDHSSDAVNLPHERHSSNSILSQEHNHLEGSTEVECERHSSSSVSSRVLVRQGGELDMEDLTTPLLLKEFSRQPSTTSCHSLTKESFQKSLEHANSCDCRKRPITVHGRSACERNTQDDLKVLQMLEQFKKIHQESIEETRRTFGSGKVNALFKHMEEQIIYNKPQRIDQFEDNELQMLEKLLDDFGKFCAEFES